MRSLRVTPVKISGCLQFGISIYPTGITFSFGKFGIFFGWDLFVEQTHDVEVTPPKKGLTEQ